MKWITALLALFMSLSAFGDKGYRNFTDQQGRTITAKIISFDSKSGKVTIERDNRKKATVSPTIFSEEDQIYINLWAKANLLKDKRSLAHSVEEVYGELSDYKTVRIKVAGNSGSGKAAVQKSTRFIRTKDMNFKVSLKNKSKIDFDNVRLEYCVFINREGAGKIADIMYCENGSTTGDLHPMSSIVLKTGIMKLFERHCSKTEDLNPAVSEREYFKEKEAGEELKGTIFRLYIADNQDTFLEFSEPANFIKKYHWNEFSAREGDEKSGLEKVTAK